jgi:hypothetical protein
LRILRYPAGSIGSTTEESTIDIASVASALDSMSKKGMTWTNENTLKRPVNFDTSATTMDSEIRKGNYSSYLY